MTLNDRFSLFVGFCTLLVGALFFWIRTIWRVTYGVSEALAGIAIASYKAHNETDWWPGNNPNFYLFLLTAGIYLIVRGLDNINQGRGQARDPIVRVMSWMKAQVYTDVPEEVAEMFGEPSTQSIYSEKKSKCGEHIGIDSESARPSTNHSSANKGFKIRKYKGLAVLFVVVVVIQIILGSLIFFSFPDWADRGVFGDMFGAVNTLFSGLAFAGVIYAIFLQSAELSLQRVELQLTRDELSKSTAAQSEQAQALLESAKINALSSQLNMFTVLVVNNRTLPNQSHTNMGDGMHITYKKLEEILNKKT